jgi:hypothetical protein
MEILFYYFITALSFTIMYIWRYSYEVMQSVMQILNILDIDYLEYDWSPISFMIASTIVSLVLMPLVLMSILMYSRLTVIKNMTAYILENSFGLIEEK